MLSGSASLHRGWGPSNPSDTSWRRRFDADNIVIDELRMSFACGDEKNSYNFSSQLRLVAV